MSVRNLTIRVPEDQTEKVRSALKAEGMKEREVSNTLWSLEGEGVYANMYPSGILLLQGQRAENFYRTVLESIQVPSKPLCGCDEAGKGDIFGPLVLSCCVIEPSNFLAVLSLSPKDSKRLRDGEITAMYRKLKDHVFSRSIVLSPERFNQLYERTPNINRIMDRAYRRLIDEVLKIYPYASVVIDAYSARNPFQDRKEVRFETKGERFVEVSCASIIARYKFIKGLKELSQLAGTDLPKGASPEARKLAGKILSQNPELARRLLKLSFVKS